VLVNGAPTAYTLDAVAAADTQRVRLAIPLATGAGAVTQVVIQHLAGPSPDYNRSGSVSVQDIFDFLSGYFAGDAEADFNGTGGISVQDIFDFLAAFFAGCL
jgi:hypothetical protein